MHLHGILLHDRAADIWSLCECVSDSPYQIKENCTMKMELVDEYFIAQSFRTAFKYICEWLCH